MRNKILILLLLSALPLVSTAFAQNTVQSQSSGSAYADEDLANESNQYDLDANNHCTKEMGNDC